MIRSLTADALTGTGVSFTTRGANRASVPVSRANYIYSHFRHVSGFPAPEGVHGVPVTKLKILDTLIERLSQVKQNRALNTGSPEPSSRKSDNQLDAMIFSMQKELATASAFPYNMQASIPSGTFVNIAA